MIQQKELNFLIKHLKLDEEGLYDYLKEVLESGNFTQEAAIGSAKQAINRGISSLSDKQLCAIAIDMLKNDVYMGKCTGPSCGEGCVEGIEWGVEMIRWIDMLECADVGRCPECERLEGEYENA
ncbi:TPA: hypothetical protein QCX73_002676 [Bacillus mycoides]|nr:hypothetical protein [Bacillus mycoides]HDR7628166.1 hypothetical protein [Bacillus mycoides]